MNIILTLILVAFGIAAGYASYGWFKQKVDGRAYEEVDMVDIWRVQSDDPFVRRQFMWHQLRIILAGAVVLGCIWWLFYG